jgi:transposase
MKPQKSQKYTSFHLKMYGYMTKCHIFWDIFYRQKDDFSRKKWGDMLRITHAHTSKETTKWLLSKSGRFEFVFTPKHGSWLNIIEMFFSKIARSFLRHIRVETKQELKDRISKVSKK